MPNWITTTTKGPNNFPAIDVLVPRLFVQVVKKGLSVGVLVRPKKPFAGSGEITNVPKMTNPKEITSVMNLIVADLPSALLVGPDGKVLATVESG